MSPYDNLLLVRSPGAVSGQVGKQLHLRHKSGFPLAYAPGKKRTP